MPRSGGPVSSPNYALASGSGGRHRHGSDACWPPWRDVFTNLAIRRLPKPTAPHTFTRHKQTACSTMRVKVFTREDGATVVLPVDLHGSFPPDFHGRLSELGDAELDMDCLSADLVLALGLCGYCVASGDDAIAVLACISDWVSPITDLE
jgi:hypothetical protein